MQSKQDLLSPEKLQWFIAGLSGLPRDEVRKAKVLYLRNAISEYRALKATNATFGCLAVMFAVVPIFWPFVYFTRRSMRIAEHLLRERILNAMNVWRDDLVGEPLDAEGEFRTG